MNPVLHLELLLVRVYVKLFLELDWAWGLHFTWAGVHVCSTTSCYCKLNFKASLTQLYSWLLLAIIAIYSYL